MTTLAQNCEPSLRTCQRSSRAFPHAEQAIADFQPNLNFARAYTPDLFNGLGKLGAGRQRGTLLGRDDPCVWIDFDVEALGELGDPGELVGGGRDHRAA